MSRSDHGETKLGESKISTTSPPFSRLLLVAFYDTQGVRWGNSKARARRAWSFEWTFKLNNTDTMYELYRTFCILQLKNKAKFPISNKLDQFLVRTGSDWVTDRGLGTTALDYWNHWTVSFKIISQNPNFKPPKLPNCTHQHQIIAGNSGDNKLTEFSNKQNSDTEDTKINFQGFNWLASLKRVIWGHRS